MQYNAYDIYSVQNKLISASLDEVDTLVKGVQFTKGYDELKTYLEEHFDSFAGEKWVDYDDLNKSVYMKIEENNIEFCALKNDEQYYGKGFKII